MSEQHKFRYLLPPGSNFGFVAKFKPVMVAALLLMVASVAMLFVNKEVRGEYLNWTIDFKGGTEIIAAVKDTSSSKYTKLEVGKVRAQLEKIDPKVDVTEISLSGQTDDSADIAGLVIRTTRFTVLTPESSEQVLAEVQATFKDREIHKANWSGDRLSVRSLKLISAEEMATVLARHDLEGTPWSPEDTQAYGHPDEGTGEYNQWYAIRGLDRQYEHAIEKAFANIDVVVMQSYGVGAKAGDKLRDDAIKSIVYAILLIMLYLAFRFDIRYAPGAALATIHDAVIVIGVFAVTYMEVSLTSVAATLTVMGYSVNDTVIVFDRIRENQAKLKDKKIERIVDISLNEMLTRSILTTATTFAATLMMNIFGTGMVKNFAFTMNVGVIVGVYSSLFLATPLFMWVSKTWYSGPPRARRRAPVAPASTPDDGDAGDPADAA